MGRVFLLAFCACVVASTPGRAQASRLFFSTSSTSPALNANPTINMELGGSASLYLFWQPTTEPDPSNPGGSQNEQLTGLGLDITDSNPILSRTNYVQFNTNVIGTTRWDTTTAGSSSGTFLVQGSNAIKLSGSHLGMIANNMYDSSYDAATGTWRVARLDFTATTAGTSNLFLGVNSAGISFRNDPTARTISFGFDDPAILTSVAPATQVLTGSGVKGDMDNSGQVTFFDIPGFELALTDPAAYQAAHPTISAAEMAYRGDMNQDNLFNDFDMQWFYNELFTHTLSGSPSSFSLISTSLLPDATVNVAVPEPASLALLIAGAMGIVVVAARRRD